jgi:ribosomal protein L7/L12
MDRDFLARSMAEAVKAQVDHVEEQLAMLFPDQYVRYQPDTGVPAEVQALVTEGKKIEAIKLYRSQTGVSLEEARAIVDGI